MQWADIKEKIPNDLAIALSDDMKTGSINENTINSYINEALLFVPVEKQSTDLAKIYVSYFVFARLYERYGYLEQSKYFKEQADAMLQKLAPQSLGTSWKAPKAFSDGRYITDVDLDRW